MVLGLVVSVTGLAPALASPGQSVSDLTTATTATDLANALVGSGVSVSNVVYAGAARAAGRFSGMNAVGFGDGVVLGSGAVNDVVGPNSETSKTSNNGTGGDADLNTLSTGPTVDASVLEFDFVPTTSHISFDYVFSSEEYTEFANDRFNDVFAFLVNGSNCAVTPGGDPVSINTINGGNPLGTNTKHPELFRNNQVETGNPPIDVEADGLTVVLSCQADVNPGVTNHVKLAIADVADGILDSNVFLKAGSFKANNAPVAQAGSATTPADTAVPVTLKATDADPGDTLTYSVVTAPTHGTLSGTGATRTYTPAAGYSGADSFTFRANDGSVNSNTATVSLTVTAPPPVNHAPVAQAGSATTPADTVVPVVLKAADADAGDTLTYSVVTAPTHGTLSGTGATRTYTPDAGYSGADSFTFKANDGKLDSDTATVSLTITPVNHAPVAQAGSATTEAGSGVPVTLKATDADAGDTLTYSVVTAPAHGTLSGTGANRTYTPAAGYFGADSFTFRASDGKLDSDTATVSLTITPVNHAPVAQAGSATTVAGAAVTVTLKATDADANPLTYAIVTAPAHGTLAGTGATRTYTPAAGYSGADSFTFKATDGKLSSNTASVAVTITPANRAPVAQAGSATTVAGTAVTVTLKATDADANPLTYAIVTAPAHGTLAGTGANRTYTPAAGYSGTDSFTFEATDGKLSSNTASVALTITPGNRAPVAQAGSATTVAGTAAAVTLKATDADANPLTYAIVTAPTHGTLSGTGANRTYTPAVGYSGADSFTFRANDGKLNSNTATVSLTVTKPNRAPVAQAGSATTVAGTAVTVTLKATDADANPLTYAIVAAPAHGTLSGTGATRTYTPAAGYSGADSFTFRANDGKLSSNTAMVTLTVTKPNRAPVAQAGAATTLQGTAVPVTLKATDADANPLTYAIVTAPGHGTLSGTGANRTYTPAAGYSGADSFTFRANDGKLNSNTATVSLTVTKVSRVYGAGRFRASATAPIYGFYFDVTKTGSTPSGPVTVVADQGKFVGTTVTSMTVSGHVSVFTVTGSLNDAAGYTLTITATDGAPDKLRMVITKGSTTVGTVSGDVYQGALTVG